MNELPDTEEGEFFDELVNQYNLQSLIRDKRTIEALVFVHNFDAELLKKVGEEFADPAQAPYIHGKRGTYVNHKCGGILCTHANKTYTREVNKTQHKTTRLDKAFDTLCLSHTIYKMRSGRES